MKKFNSILFFNVFLQELKINLIYKEDILNYLTFHLQEIDSSCHYNLNINEASSFLKSNKIEKLHLIFSFLNYSTDSSIEINNEHDYYRLKIHTGQDHLLIIDRNYETFQEVIGAFSYHFAELNKEAFHHLIKKNKIDNF